MLAALVTVVPRTISQSLSAVGLSAIMGLAAYSYGLHKGHQQSANEHATQALKASEAARTIERQWQAQLQNVQNEAKDREDKIRADVDSVRAERDRLRKQLTANHVKLPAFSRTAVTQYAVTVSDVFEQCTKRLEEVARAADGHANDALMPSTALDSSAR
jgi:uncharacterized protein HemX